MEVFAVKERESIAPLFRDWPETMIWSYLQGCMGSAWADCLQRPRSAKIDVGDFWFLAGEPQEELVRSQPGERTAGFAILVPGHEGWSQAIQSVWGDRAVRRERYATRKDTRFHPEKLRTHRNDLPTGCRLHPIDGGLYRQIRKLDWARDLVSQFKDGQDYASRGIGVAVLEGETVISGASSYTVYRGGIEIEIDTRPDRRRRGLARACGAALILACLERGWYPSWDAHNRASLALSAQLGYRLDRPYPVYEVAWDQ